MRIQVISDMHIDVRAGFEPSHIEGAEAIVVAGDVCEGIASGMAFLRTHIAAEVPIVMVAGNHEFYHLDLNGERAAAVEAAERHRICFLDDSAATVAGVRFVGATLWTDFALFGADTRMESMAVAAKTLADFRSIKIKRGRSRRAFTPGTSWRLHQDSVAYLEGELARPHPGPTVVVTHHAPHRSSVDPRFAGDNLTPAFVSDLSRLIEQYQPALWVHGHVHHSFDYRIGRTRIVCNPRGYGRENRRFDAALTIDF